MVISWLSVQTSQHIALNTLEVNSTSCYVSFTTTRMLRFSSSLAGCPKSRARGTCDRVCCHLYVQSVVHVHTHTAAAESTHVFKA